MPGEARKGSTGDQLRILELGQLLALRERCRKRLAMKFLELGLEIKRFMLGRPPPPCTGELSAWLAGDDATLSALPGACRPRLAKARSSPAVHPEPGPPGHTRSAAENFAAVAVVKTYTNFKRTTLNYPNLPGGQGEGKTSTIPHLPIMNACLL